jgi:hypothetical protein
MAVLEYPDGSFVYASWTEVALHGSRDWTHAEDLAIWLTMGIAGLAALITIAGFLSRGDRRLMVDMVFTVSLWVLVIMQLVSIFPAAVRLPRHGDFYEVTEDTPGKGWYTEKCMASDKGGRIPFPYPFKDRAAKWELNPCYCKLPAVCMGNFKRIGTEDTYQFVETLCRECIPNWESEQYLNLGLNYQYCNKTDYWTGKPEKDCIVNRPWCPDDGERNERGESVRETKCILPATGCYYTEEVAGKFQGTIPILEAVVTGSLMKCQDACCERTECKGVQFELPSHHIPDATSSTMSTSVGSSLTTNASSVDASHNCILLKRAFNGNDFTGDQYTLLSNRIPGGFEVKAYHGNKKRDCNRMQGEYCTPAEPCAPCEVETLLKFPGVWGESWRCRKCSSSYTGDCNFVEHIGPYCKKDPFSREIVPCKRCCSEDPTLKLHTNPRLVCA